MAPRWERRNKTVNGENLDEFHKGWLLIVTFRSRKDDLLYGISGLQSRLVE